MNPDELLLRDIHLPGPVSWWPPAPGWWLLAGALILLVATTIWWWRRRARARSAPAALARTELDRLYTRWRQHQDPQQLVREVSVWLRRAGMTLTTRRQAASPTGDAWRSLLDELAGEVVFADDLGRLITEAPYRRETAAVTTADGERLLVRCERWLRAVARGAQPS